MMVPTSTKCRRIVTSPAAACAVGTPFDAGYYWKGFQFIMVIPIYTGTIVSRRK